MDPCFSTSRTARCRKVLFIMNKYAHYCIIFLYLTDLVPNVKSDPRLFLGVWRRGVLKKTALPRKKLLTAECTEKNREGRREEKNIRRFARRSLRLFSAHSAVKSFAFASPDRLLRG